MAMSSDQNKFKHKTHNLKRLGMWRPPIFRVENLN